MKKLLLGLLTFSTASAFATCVPIKGDDYGLTYCAVVERINDNTIRLSEIVAPGWRGSYSYIRASRAKKVCRKFSKILGGNKKYSYVRGSITIGYARNVESTLTSEQSTYHDKPVAVLNTIKCKAR